MSVLLGDVPQMTCGVQSQQTILDGDLVESGALFVAEERVRDPDLLPRSVAQAELGDLVRKGSEDEAGITPLLPQVHAHRVVLYAERHATLSVYYRTLHSFSREGYTCMCVGLHIYVY